MSADEKKPYGDVRYADPGYQADNKMRHPIDTPEHVRAAWFHINQAGNAARYTPTQREQIKTRIRSAARQLGLDIEVEHSAWQESLRARYLSPGIEMAETESAPLDEIKLPTVAQVRTSLHIDDVEEAEHSGCMVAFFVEPDLAGRMAVPGGEEVDSLHLTLAYLPVTPGGPDLDRLIGIVEGVASSFAPIKAMISGIGVFTLAPGQGDAEAVTYASVDAPALADFRQELVRRLESAGFMPSKMHGFTPHISLAYDKKPEIKVPIEETWFRKLSLAAGENRWHFDFGQELNVENPHRAYTEERTEPVPEVETLAEVEPTKAFVTEVNHKTLITGPASIGHADFESARTPNDYFMWIQGRFVGGEVPNRNNALWTAKDLEVGELTVRHGPLNWLHQARHIIGCLVDQKLVRPDAESAAGVIQPHLQVASAVYRWIYPDEAAVIEQAVDQQQAFYSMECVSEKVMCVGANGCGKELAYGDYIRAQGVCDHMLQRSSTRRFVNPTFLGGAVIVPPVRPGWADAHMTLMRQASGYVEDALDQIAGQGNLSAKEWEETMAQVLIFAGVETA